jgi:hypothetical protein
MSFLKRLFGADASTPTQAPPAAPLDPAAAQDEENARDRELMREDAQRLDDDLIQRQLRYADRSWTPPAQGGTRRADDEEGSDSGEG